LPFQITEYGLVVLHRQPVHGDVGAVDDQAVRCGVGRPADAAAVVGPPQPQIVADDVVAVDVNADGGLAGGSPADAGKDVGKYRRVGRVVRAGTARADLQQDGVAGPAGIEEQPTDPDAVHVGGHWPPAVCRVGD
jgi:hypothetical protein